MPPLADKLGEAGLAWDVAHGHAQHLQVSIPGLLQRARGDALRIARQADGHAGATPGGLPSPVVNNRDIRHRLWAAAMPGAHGYAPRTHHDAGEERALALRRGLRCAVSGDKNDDVERPCTILGGLD